MLQIDGTECLTLADLARMSGISTEALRQRQSRGTLKLTPLATIHGQHFYRAAEVRALVQEGL